MDGAPVDDSQQAHDRTADLWVPDVNLPAADMLPASYVQSEAVRLLITAADAFPPDAQLEGQSEVAVGYWTGKHFRYLLDDYQARRVSRWALLAPCLPTDIKLKRDRRFDPDVRG